MDRVAAGKIFRGILQSEIGMGRAKCRGSPISRNFPRPRGNSTYGYTEKLQFNVKSIKRF